MSGALVLKKLAIGVLAWAALPLVGHASILEGSASPESVLRYGDDLLVANVGAKLEPTAKDGNGFIGRFQQGKVLEKDIFAGKVMLNAPKGMGIYKDVLYVADIDRIVGIDLKAKQQVLELSFAEQGAGFLNDVVITDAGVLYISATDKGAIYSVDLAKGDAKPAIAKLPIAPLPGPNGLFFDAQKQRLIVASFGVNKTPGELGIVDLRNNSYSVVPGVHGLFDGVSLLNEQTLLTSDWGKFERGAGELKQVDLVSGKVTVVRQGLSGPADFVMLGEGEYALPNMMDGSIVVENLKH
ncbi:hypothetical protein [Pseudomonas sp. 2FE]|uniref:hypothetical protein n=1 Tax=Pseudomonas sp. 2FE TaxID=2502190 RepID=UPI0010F931D0|nr:hypothetical protein [Pseudomonas sp. 2FE]